MFWAIKTEKGTRRILRRVATWTVAAVMLLVAVLPFAAQASVAVDLSPGATLAADVRVDSFPGQPGNDLWMHHNFSCHLADTVRPVATRPLIISGTPAVYYPARTRLSRSQALDVPTRPPRA